MIEDLIFPPKDLNPIRQTLHRKLHGPVETIYYVDEQDNHLTTENDEELIKR